MSTLKGQNLRVCLYDSTAAKYKVVAMATNCGITLTNNTEESSHKDVVGMAAMPTIVSKSWQVSVDSLNVTDASTILSAIKSMTPFTLMWDETSTTDNQTRQKAAFARKGSAYLSDVTFTFNDRENSAKQLQFVGTSALELVTPSEAVQVVQTGMYTKGQFVRLFLSADNTTSPTTVIGAAKQLSLHVSLSLEDSSTKDTTGEWLIQEPTALNYDITTNALVRGNDTITSQVPAQGLGDLENIYAGSTPVRWAIYNVSGANNRTIGAMIVSGSAILSSLQINGQNRSNADYTAQLTGYGNYTVAA